MSKTISLSRIASETVVPPSTPTVTTTLQVVAKPDHNPRKEKNIFERQWQAFVVGSSILCLITIIILVSRMRSLRKPKPGSMNFKDFSEQLTSLDDDVQGALLLEEGKGSSKKKQTAVEDRSGMSIPLSSICTSDVNKSDESVKYSFSSKSAKRYT